MTAKHSQLMRGLEAAGLNPNLKGARFGRLFPTLPPASFGGTSDEERHNLDLLAKAMISPFDEPKDAPDDEESGIPALYTYFGQFIDHDLTFDPDASFQKVKDPDAREDFRTPAFDLDNLYGRGPGDQPYMYADDGKSFLLGEPLTQGSLNARDLQRNAAGRAMIGDPRNDENTIVSQLQGLMLRFHNGMVARNDALPFQRIQELVRHHYQYVVVNDFLSRIVHKSVLDELKSGGVFDKSKLKFFNDFAPTGIPYMPVEFSVAAYRLGHSMIRPGYRLNDAVLLPIFPLPDLVKPRLPEGLTGFRRMVSDWGIDWARFIDIETRDYGVALQDPPQRLTHEQTIQNFRRLQFAYRLDTALVDPLAALPASVADNSPKSLAYRNLLRGSEFGLPSGQTVATHMGVPVIDDADIMLGQGTDARDNGAKPITALGPIFTGNCPLWTYILAEAMQDKANWAAPKVLVTPAKTITTPQLGPVGGRIVAEVFLGLMFADPGAYLHSKPDWKPDTGGDYRLRDLVSFALAH